MHVRLPAGEHAASCATVCTVRQCCSLQLKTIRDVAEGFTARKLSLAPNCSCLNHHPPTIRIRT